MKSSLALYLLALLSLLATLHIVGQAKASATEAPSATTKTSQSSFLREPHRPTLPTRVMSTQRRISTLKATTWQRQPVARSTKSPMAHAKSSSSPTSSTLAKHIEAVDSSVDLKQNPNTARTLRSEVANKPNIRNNGARQNRSLKSVSSSQSIASNLVSNGATRSSSGSSTSKSLTASGSKQQKNERVDRHRHFRTIQYSSHEPKTNKNQTSLPLAVSTSNNSTSRHEGASMLDETKNLRGLKEPSMPLKDVDTLEDSRELTEHDIQIQKNATQQRQTAKTPRMIHRLVAGHLQNAEESSSYQISAVSGNNTILKSTTTSKEKATLIQQRKVSKPTKTSAKYSSSTISGTATSKPETIQDPLVFSDATDNQGPDDDDEALLNDSDDFDNWDNGILRLSAGSGKENSKPKKHNKKDDSKKTLSDQVRDGKYGLIEKELFRREPKRPGVLSYLPNKEVPIDNEKNFGGLQEEDIWLAEDHLLVIKGGSLNEEKPHEEPWPAIDDYDAPGRQIKIPPNPKVPPPFPVQLEENGPVQFIGNNKFTIVYPIANESIPVYTFGPETDTTSSENDSDNEKNIITRTGAPQDVANGGGEPHYVYPSPYPSWLFNNQTFVNPLLSNARPITFPGLGPFPLARNGSLDNVNGTEFLDEDDPTLYYPPAYSFVYKNNYTNAVPPGPLVPGIVLPPPANQFSRLENVERVPSIQPRQRTTSTTTAPTTTSKTISTTTTVKTTTSKEPIPFRNIITKISEYTPKIINITPAIPIAATATPPTLPASLTTTPDPSISIEPIPVPVAIPIPVYPGRTYPSSRPNILSFVPTTQEPVKEDTLTKSHPIYYEYFEAKRQPIKTNVIDDFLASTVEPPHPTPKPIKLYATSKRPFKSQQQQQRNYLQPQRLPFKENIVYITPKPEVQKHNLSPHKEIYVQRPLENFEQEVHALRETLRYYHNQQLRENTIPRTPKVKPIYEFSFDASKNIQRPSANFHPRPDYDEQPFKPMVTYSPPVNDENSFRPMAYDKVDIEASQKLTAEPKKQVEKPKYQSTTTLIPVSKDTEYHVQQSQPLRLKKQRLSAKYLQEPFRESTFDQQSQQQPTKIERPWVAVTKVPLDNYETPPEEQAERSERYHYPVPKNKAFAGGYYYGPPPPTSPIHNRQNNRFYDEPFQHSVRKLIQYRPRQNSQYQQRQPHQHHQPQNYWNLENDTYVNYAPNRPPLNPDAEFIDPYQTVPVNPYAGQVRYAPPAISHQSQYYAQPRQQIPLHRDILVNYRHPLPPINPDSEYISHPNSLRNRGNQIYRSDSYDSQPPPLFDDNVDGQPNLYYVSPKYRRASNNNSNNNKNIGNNNANPANKQNREDIRNDNIDINNGK